MNDEPKLSPTPPPSREGVKGVASTLGLLLLAPLLALILTAFIFQSYEVDGPSMQTTLQNKDRLIVLKVPRTWARLTHHDYIPDRGDIIIFNHPDINGLGGAEKQLIKRVIALPGERVVVKDGQVTVYNQANPNGFSPDHTLPYGSVIKDTSGEVDLTVPAGEVFVCGDNRSNSLDSRYFGTVPAGNIVGKLGLRVYPFSQSQVF
jgi:signal peptidase I